MNHMLNENSLVAYKAASDQSEDTIKVRSLSKVFTPGFNKMMHNYPFVNCAGSHFENEN